MPKITSIATAVPQYRITQEDAKEFARINFSESSFNLSRLLPIFENTGIKQRFFSCPPDWFGKIHSLEEKNEIYVNNSTELSAKAAVEAMKIAGVTSEDIDYILYINTTGIATPSIDARLINKLGFRSDVHRSPVWGLGCAGGVSGVSQAYHYLLGHPDERVLLVACELCGLTFIADDKSKSNLVATSLFGEGAAAVILSGDNIESSGLNIVGTKSRFFPDSLDVMGWNIVNQGMQVVFAQRIPEIVEKNAYDDISNFLSEYNLTTKDIKSWIVHPGGAKVIKAYKKALKLNEDDFMLSRMVLEEYGNMSSVTVLFVLDKYIRQNGLNGNGYSLMSALGPGFSSESVLLTS